MSSAPIYPRNYPRPLRHFLKTLKSRWDYLLCWTDVLGTILFGILLTVGAPIAMFLTLYLLSHPTSPTYKLERGMVALAILCFLLFCAGIYIFWFGVAEFLIILFRLRILHITLPIAGGLFFLLFARDIAQCVSGVICKFVNFNIADTISLFKAGNYVIGGVSIITAFLALLYFMDYEIEE